MYVETALVLWGCEIKISCSFILSHPARRMSGSCSGLSHPGEQQVEYVNFFHVCCLPVPRFRQRALKHRIRRWTPWERESLILFDDFINFEDYIASVADQWNTSVEHSLNDTDGRKPKCLERNLSSATSSAISFTWSGLGSKSGLRSDRRVVVYFYSLSQYSYGRIAFDFLVAKSEGSSLDLILSLSRPVSTLTVGLLKVHVNVILPSSSRS